VLHGAPPPTGPRALIYMPPVSLARRQTFSKSSLLERRGRGSAPNYVSPRGESGLGAAARAWLSCSTG